MINTGFSLRYRIDILRKGRRVKRTAWRNHMITDAGLDLIGSDSSKLLTHITVPILGENVAPTPVRRDGGAVTFSQAGNTLSTTGAAAFFVAADVGRLFKFGAGDAGAECYITGFSSASSVTVSTSATVGATSGVVWYVNTAAILTPITGLTWNADAGVANNYSTPTVLGDVCTFTHQTVRISSAFAAAKTITEIAFTRNGTNTSVFDRDVIQPGVSAAIGDQARVTVQLITTHSGITAAAQTNVGTGCDTSGTFWLESLDTSNGSKWSAFTSTGSVGGGGAGEMEPAAQVQIALLNAAITPNAFSASSALSRTLPVGNYKVVTKSAYGTGNRFTEFIALFSITEGNGSIYGYAIGSPSNGGQSFVVKFSAPFTKLSTQTLSVTFRKYWNRVITN